MGRRGGTAAATRRLQTTVGGIRVVDRGPGCGRHKGLQLRRERWSRVKPLGVAPFRLRAAAATVARGAIRLGAAAGSGEGPSLGQPRATAARHLQRRRGSYDGY